ncbi:MAG: isoaspartyl peptidase/L-asparaginase [Bacteroidales bacterium]|nr:isoaspartyl peptidase/L-asparaginase [Bacteroidales bacterium]
MKTIKPYLWIIVLFIIPVILFIPVIKFLNIDIGNNTNKKNENYNNNLYAIAIHGGAGNFSKNDIPDSIQVKYKTKLSEALDSGIYILKNNGTAIDAVEKTIMILENSPLFNAGKGAVFTHNGTNELDASIMDGKTLNAGAVAGVTNIKNPISAAKLVMINSEHVLLSGEGALEFAKNQNLEIVDREYFYTDKRWENLQKILKKENELSENKHGTVGCVALDKYGNLAAGTSTGGRTNKKYGRIGDSPIIGAGTYANNKTCAISSTGHGEYFIRYVVAYDISALIEYKNYSLQEAADYVINNKLVKANGNGGIIAIDKTGNITFSFNTSGMFRGYAKSNGDRKVFMF